MSEFGGDDCNDNDVRICIQIILTLNLNAQF